MTPAAQLLHPHPPSSTPLTAPGQSAAHVPAQPLPLSQGINESKAFKMKQGLLNKVMHPQALMATFQVFK